MEQETQMERKPKTFRFNGEISLGDVLTLVGGLAIVFKLWFSVGDHEKRISGLEAEQGRETRQLSDHSTEIAVLQDRVGGYAPVGPLKGGQQLIERDK